MLHSNQAPTDRWEGQRSFFTQEESDSYAGDSTYWGEWDHEEDWNDYDSDGTTSEQWDEEN
eukprot:5754002-Amphidinium_carterae.1